MASDGRQLEVLVAFAEKLHLPPGFSVETNTKVLNDEGEQIAEFDIEIRGKVGTTDFLWLIECRDRPSAGAAPGSWIEQLVGRRSRFGFSKVTAVSTTGFAAGASEFARQQGIELREALALTPESFSEWLQLTTMTQRLRVHDLKHADILLDESEPHRKRVAAEKFVKDANPGAAVLMSNMTGERVTAAEAFIGAVRDIPDAFSDVTPSTPRPIAVCAEFPTDDHYVIPTSEGGVRVAAIQFDGELRIEEREYPVVSTTEYRHQESGAAISQVVAFAPQSLLGQKLSFELHRVTATGQIHVIARRLPQ
jgi:hypothetical protein